MTTQYTTILKLALPVQGELSGTWGDVVNDNITSMVEEAVAGRKVINTWTANSHTLTSADGTTSESRAAILTLTDTGTALTGAGTVVCPALSKVYIVENSTAQVITIKTSGGTGIAVPVGRNMVVFCDGTNVEEGISNIASLSIGGDGATVTGIKDEDDMSSDSATKLATQQSIKAYVDSQVGANNELSEVLANGNTTGGTDIAVGTGDDITFADNSKAIFGAGSDLQIYHDGSHSYVSDQGTGDLRILAADFRIRNAADDETMIQANSDTDVSLWYNNSKKLATTNTGIDVTGVITTDGMTTSADINFGDNNKAIFGVGSDLQIYHDGSNSYIKDDGTGDLRIWADSPNIATASGNKIFFGNSGNAELYAAGGAIRLATTSTGIDVTGSVVSDGATIAGTLELDSNNFDHTAATPQYNMIESDVTGNNTQFLQTAGDLRIRTVDDSVSNPVERLRIDHGTGDISFYEDTGTTPKLFWDASTERLGIGTSSPSGLLHVASTGATNIKIEDTDSGFAATELNVENGGRDFKITTPKDTIFVQGSTEAMRILDDGNVGIGTDSPQQVLHISQGASAGTTALRIENTESGIDPSQVANAIEFYTNDASAGGTGVTGKIAHVAVNAGTTYALTFSSYDGSSLSEAMRIDSSGNLLVGLTSTSGIATGSTADNGVYVDGSVGAVVAQSSANKNLYCSKASGYSDPDFISFQVAGSAVGSIGTIASDLYIGEGNSGLRFDGENNQILPSSTTASTDGTCNLGAASARFKDLYLSGTVTATDLTLSDTNTPTLTITDTTNTTTLFLEAANLSTTVGTSTDHPLKFDTNNTERMRIDSSGLVSIKNVAAPTLRLENTDTSLTTNQTIGDIDFYQNDPSGTGVGVVSKIRSINDSSFQGEASLAFYTGNTSSLTERMRIDASGNLLVGTTNANPTSSGVNDPGVELSDTGGVRSTVDANPAATFNRKTDNGTIALFRKDGTTVGSIGSEGGDALYIQSGTTSGSGFRFHPTNGAIDPLRNGSSADNSIDLGRSGARFQDIFATNGTIQTSDRNEKQDIEALSEAEQRVAVAAKGLLRKFRWISSVEAKGDDARIHFGIIAQDLQDAFTAEGLDAGRYAMFISSTWTDEDTGEERTRLGVRYSELLAFIISAI